MIEKLIGQPSNKVKNNVERSQVKKFAEAIGDTNPMYTNEEVGLQSRHGQNIAPVTFPRVFDYGVIEGLQLPKKGLIHGEQTYRYQRPLTVGETIYCYQEIIDFYNKKEMLFIVIRGYGEDEEQKEVFNVDQVTIVTETVRKENNL